jgi:hypothetical protein
MPGAAPSNAAWQIPQTSSLAFQLHFATPWKHLIRTTIRRVLLKEPPGTFVLSSGS